MTDRFKNDCDQGRRGPNRDAQYFGPDGPGPTDPVTRALHLAALIIIITIAMLALALGLGILLTLPAPSAGA